MTVAAGRMSPRLLLRWLLVVGALTAVTLFGGASTGDGTLSPVSAAGHNACPNVILQASLPGALLAGTGTHTPDGGHGPSDSVAGACLFVVVALAGLALAGLVRRPLLVHLGHWWARLRDPLSWSPMPGLTQVDVLRI